LACTGTSYQSHLFTWFDGQIEVINDTRRFAIVEINLTKFNSAAGYVEDGRVRFVLNLAGNSQRVNAVLHRADALKQAGNGPHDPLGHGVKTHDQRERSCHG